MTGREIAGRGEEPTAARRVRVLLVGSDHAITRGLASALALTNWATPLVVDPLTPPRPESPLERVSMDPRDARDWRRALPGFDAVIHAGFGDAARMATVNAAMTRAAAELAQQPRIVHMGSMTTYGSAVGLIDEDAPLRGDLGHYSAAHAEADVAIGRLKNAVRLRLGVEITDRKPRTATV